MISCKGKAVQGNAPFNIKEKTYFYWVEGKEGGKGTTIRLSGTSTTTNLSISKVFFQNHEYEVVPDWRGMDFAITGNRIISYSKDITMSADPGREYGNQAPPIGKKIPFDIEDDEAVIKYAVNGAEAFLKVSGIKQLDTVYRP